MIESLASNNPVSGGLENHSPSWVCLEFNDYRELTRFQEYLTDEYCVACAYFRTTKGHFGTCPDLPYRKPYDGTKKGSACSCWRLRTAYVSFNIEQKLPEKPIIRINWLRRKERLGSYTSRQDLRRMVDRITRKSFRERKFHIRIDDYSYPECDICGGKTARSGHTSYGAQLFQCQSCEHIIIVNSVVTARPEPKPVYSIEYIQTLLPLRMAFDYSNEDLTCSRCGSNRSNLIKHGFYYSPNQRKSQKWQCKKCGFHFEIAEDGKRFHKSKYPKIIDNFILTLAKGGYSTRAIANEVLDKFDVRISNTAVLRKIKKYAPEVSVHEKHMLPTDRGYEIWIQKRRGSAEEA